MPLNALELLGGASCLGGSGLFLPASRCPKKTPPFNGCLSYSVQTQRYKINIMKSIVGVSDNRVLLFNDGGFSVSRLPHSEFAAYCYLRSPSCAEWVSTDSSRSSPLVPFALNAWSSNSSVIARTVYSVQCLCAHSPIDTKRYYSIVRTLLSPVRILI